MVTPGGSRRARESGRLPAVDGLAMLVLLALAAWAVWPVYGVVREVLVVAVAAALGMIIAVIASGRRWGWAATSAATVVGYLLAVLPLAVPSSLTAFPTGLGYGIRLMLRAPVTGWKDLATTPLPVGDFQALLVPLLVVVLLVTVVTATVLLRRPERAPWTTIPLLAPILFAIAWGPSTISVPFSVGSWHLGQPREVLTGVLWVAAVVLWLCARRRWVGSQTFREPATRRARGRPSGGARGRRGLLAAATMVVAVAVALAGAPDWTGHRIVVRSIVEPSAVQQPTQTPLAGFRAYFESPALDEALLRVDGVSAGTRLRVATLGSYDGHDYQVLDDDDPQARLQRLAFRIPVDGHAGVPSRQATVTVDRYDGPWVPTFGRAVTVDFHGAQARTLDGALFVDPTSASVLEDAGGRGGGLQLGDRYTVTYRPTSQPDDAEGPAGPVHAVTEAEAPQLFTWLAHEDEPGTTIGSVRALVAKMMLRSYLGHSLLEPTSEGGAPTWLSRTQQHDDGFTFRPSYAGHGLARIDDGVFGKMNEAASSCDDEDCAATVGDQEQYAVAAALLAEAKGFAARVVLGARVPQGGVVHGSDVTAWTEVQGADGRWAVIDVQPRTDSLFTDVDTALTPRSKPTKVTDDGARELAPPAQKPQTGSANEHHQSDSAVHDRSPWWPVVRLALWALLALAVLGLPFLVVVMGKRMRRRRRRTRGNPVARVAGGWAEYVDRCRDAGAAPVGNQTRQEVAERWGHGLELAALADRATFSDGTVSERAVREYWSLVMTELATARATRGRFRRWRSAVSLRSIRDVR